MRLFAYPPVRCCGILMGKENSWFNCLGKGNSGGQRSKSSCQISFNPIGGQFIVWMKKIENGSKGLANAILFGAANKDFGLCEHCLTFCLWMENWRARELQCNPENSWRAEEKQTPWQVFWKDVLLDSREQNALSSPADVIYKQAEQDNSEFLCTVVFSWCHEGS